MHDMCDPSGKYPNLSSSHRGKNMLSYAAQRADNNANPSWLSEKKCLLRRKDVILSVRWKFHCIAKVIVALFL